MPKLPRVSGQTSSARWIRWVSLRFASAGVTLYSNESRRKERSAVSFPLHPELAVGTLRGILKQAGVAPEEFIAQL